MKCANCNRSEVEQGICNGCAKRLRHCLAELPGQVAMARQCLSPSRGGHGTNTGEPTIGVNVLALDWVTGRPVTDLLWEWEKVIRTERGLTPPAHLPPAKDEVSATVRFHLAHLQWITDQPWVKFYSAEIQALHKQGQFASQTQREAVRRIACPSPHPEDSERYCNRMLAVESNDLLESITCPKCNTNWTPARLVAVAMSDPNRVAYLDIEGIATWLGLSERQCRRIARSAEVERKGSLYNFTQFLAAYRDSI